MVKRTKTVRLKEAKTIRKLKGVINVLLNIDTPSLSLDRRINKAYTHLNYVHNALHRYT